MKWPAIIMVLAAACLAGCKEDVPAENNGGQLPADAIFVTTPQELLAAIGPNRTIVLTNGGTYLMNHLDDLPRSRSEFYSWLSVREFDDGEENYELQITNCPGLSILAPEGEQAHIVSPYYGAEVMSFSRCDGLRLANLKIGHAPPSGYCGAGVLGIEGSDDVEIADTTIYGCGLWGLGLIKVTNLVFTRSVIEQCAARLIVCQDSDGLTFRQSQFRDTDLWGSAFLLFNTTNVKFDNCQITNNHALTESRWGPPGSLFLIEPARPEAAVVFNGGTIRGNSAAGLVEPPDMVTLNDVTLEENTWSAAPPENPIRAGSEQ